MVAELSLAGRANRASSKNRVIACGSSLLLVVALLVPIQARAASSDNTILDGPALIQLEQQAMTAQPREQCFLFSQVVHSLTEEAGREIAAGQEEQAQATLHHADAVLAKMHAAVQQDAKRLKNAEMLMQHASRRLADIMHVASENSRDVVQATLQKLNALHSELLAQVFAK